jgi:hypothetical protein
LILFAATISTLVGTIAWIAGARGRGLTFLLFAVLLVAAPHVYPALGEWLRGYRRAAIAALVISLAVLAMLWPTPLFVVDVMTAVPPP